MRTYTGWLIRKFIGFHLKISVFSILREQPINNFAARIRSRSHIFLSIQTHWKRPSRCNQSFPMSCSVCGINIWKSGDYEAGKTRYSSFLSITRTVCRLINTEILCKLHGRVFSAVKFSLYFCKVRHFKDQLKFRWKMIEKVLLVSILSFYWTRGLTLHYTGWVFALYIHLSSRFLRSNLDQLKTWSLLKITI